MTQGWAFRLTQCLLILGLMSACSVDNARKHYILAEKLWTDRKYHAAANEFEKAAAKDPKGKLGLQSLYRLALTQALFLSDYNGAIRNLRTFIQRSSDAQMIWDAQLEVGELLYSKLELYEQAVGHYQSLLNQKPESAEAPGFLFRIGKAQYFLYQFSDAIQTFQQIEKKYSRTIWAEKAMFEIGNTYLTRGEQAEGQDEQAQTSVSDYKSAIQVFEDLLKRYPKTSLLPEARFGIASSLEELDRLTEAYEAFKALRPLYPATRVIDIKLSRIKERISKKSGTSR